MKLGQDDILRIRASFGRWRLPDGECVIISENPHAEVNGLRQYRIKHLRGYKPSMERAVDAKAVITAIKLLRNLTAVQEYMMYPELKEFFRNGEPVTSATIFQDAFNDITSTDKPLSSMDALLEAFN